MAVTLDVNQNYDNHFRKTASHQGEFIETSSPLPSTHLSPTESSSTDHDVRLHCDINQVEPVFDDIDEVFYQDDEDDNASVRSGGFVKRRIDRWERFSQGELPLKASEAVRRGETGPLGSAESNLPAPIVIPPTFLHGSQSLRYQSPVEQDFSSIRFNVIHMKADFQMTELRLKYAKWQYDVNKGTRTTPPRRLMGAPDLRLSGVAASQQGIPETKIPRKPTTLTHQINLASFRDDGMKQRESGHQPGYHRHHQPATNWRTAVSPSHMGQQSGPMAQIGSRQPNLSMPSYGIQRDTLDSPNGHSISFATQNQPSANIYGLEAMELKLRHVNKQVEMDRASPRRELASPIQPFFDEGQQLRENVGSSGMSSHDTFRCHVEQQEYHDVPIAPVTYTIPDSRTILQDDIIARTNEDLVNLKVDREKLINDLSDILVEQDATKQEEQHQEERISGEFSEGSDLGENSWATDNSQSSVTSTNDVGIQYSYHYDEGSCSDASEIAMESGTAEMLPHDDDADMTHVTYDIRQPLGISESQNKQRNEQLETSEETCKHVTTKPVSDDESVEHRVEPTSVITLHDQVHANSTSPSDVVAQKRHIDEVQPEIASVDSPFSLDLTRDTLDELESSVNCTADNQVSELDSKNQSRTLLSPSSTQTQNSPGDLSAHDCSVEPHVPNDALDKHGDEHEPSTENIPHSADPIAYDSETIEQTPSSSNYTDDVTLEDYDASSVGDTSFGHHSLSHSVTSISCAQMEYQSRKGQCSDNSVSESMRLSGEPSDPCHSMDIATSEGDKDAGEESIEKLVLISVLANPNTQTCSSNVQRGDMLDMLTHEMNSFRSQTISDDRDSTFRVSHVESQSDGQSTNNGTDGEINRNFVPENVSEVLSARTEVSLDFSKMVSPPNQVHRSAQLEIESSPYCPDGNNSDTVSVGKEFNDGTEEKAHLKTDVQLNNLEAEDNMIEEHKWNGNNDSGELQVDVRLPHYSDVYVKGEHEHVTCASEESSDNSVELPSLANSNHVVSCPTEHTESCRPLSVGNETEHQPVYEIQPIAEQKPSYHDIFCDVGSSEPERIDNITLIIASGDNSEPVSLRQNKTENDDIGNNVLEAMNTRLPTVTSLASSTNEPAKPQRPAIDYQVNQNKTESLVVNENDTKVVVKSSPRRSRIPLPKSKLNRSKSLPTRSRSKATSDNLVNHREAQRKETNLKKIRNKGDISMDQALGLKIQNAECSRPSTTTKLYGSLSFDDQKYRGSVDGRRQHTSRIPVSKTMLSRKGSCPVRSRSLIYTKVNRSTSEDKVNPDLSRHASEVGRFNDDFKTETMDVDATKALILSYKDKIARALGKTEEIDDRVAEPIKSDFTLANRNENTSMNEAMNVPEFQVETEVDEHVLDEWNEERIPHFSKIPKANASRSKSLMRPELTSVGKGCDSSEVMRSAKKGKELSIDLFSSDSDFVALETAMEWDDMNSDTLTLHSDDEQSVTSSGTVRDSQDEGQNKSPIPLPTTGSPTIQEDPLELSITERSIARILPMPRGIECKTTFTPGNRKSFKSRIPVPSPITKVKQKIEESEHEQICESEEHHARDTEEDLEIESPPGRTQLSREVQPRGSYWSFSTSSDLAASEFERSQTLRLNRSKSSGKTTPRGTPKGGSLRRQPGRAKPLPAFKSRECAFVPLPEWNRLKEVLSSGENSKPSSTCPSSPSDSSYMSRRSSEEFQKMPSSPRWETPVTTPIATPKQSRYRADGRVPARLKKKYSSMNDMDENKDLLNSKQHKGIYHSKQDVVDPATTTAKPELDSPWVRRTETSPTTSSSAISLSERQPIVRNKSARLIPEQTASNASTSKEVIRADKADPVEVLKEGSSTGEMSMMTTETDDLESNLSAPAGSKKNSWKRRFSLRRKKSVGSTQSSLQEVGKEKEKKKKKKWLKWLGL